jgi:protein-S-isoprenylcysteine O-methyltransferase Ste14
MQFITEFKIGLWNGWIPLCLYGLIFGILMKMFPKEVVKMLYGHDRFGLSKTQRILFIVGKSLSFLCLVIIIFTPLKIEANISIIGTILYVLGLGGVIFALFNFKNTQIGQPVTKGIYKISRNPQEFMIFILFLGICMTIGSWLALLILVLSKVFAHFGILSQERACLEKYGDSYKEYMKKTPRYFLFF